MSANEFIENEKNIRLNDGKYFLHKNWLILSQKYVVAALSVSGADAVMQRGVYFILPPPLTHIYILGDGKTT
jgi:hypothetical protein